ncbi:MAG TPA: AAA family ATPase [Pirellulaceae bacterium]|nr:AAA family ATPase [Pirellulaceae bacterium]HMO93583.1 AAA family ATPase [Pirellulaceae bacterium]HMP71552.1 AAA family ATPase [Pirellulaceae bacterium]
MYIARIRIQNYRCFRDSIVEFQPGLNVIIGENNAGKTTLLKAIALVFDRRSQDRPTVHDFYSLLAPIDAPPRITISVTLRSSATDTLADRALVASWLTSLDTQWEAQLTYKFFLPDTDEAAFRDALGGTTDRTLFFEIIDEFLPKYVTRVYGGNPDTVVSADSDTLSKFDCQFLDALRDVESEMFSGRNPLLRSMLEEVLDIDKQDGEKRQLRSAFRERSKALRTELIGRLDTPRLFKLVSETGASDGGTPTLDGGVQESDLVAALKLFIERESFAFPATHQGLGYNNLIYISLLLASISFRASEKRRGQNAAVFPMLLIEEPEAHLHPALQYKLLSHIVSRVEKEPHLNRQVFMTTHSTHVTSAARLAPIICLSVRETGEIGIAYPSRLFPETTAGKESRTYVERYLDATKSAMLFAKATLFVEGIAEQMLVPAFALRDGLSFDDHHVAVVRVDGVTFKHFLPLFGAGVATNLLEHSLHRRVACLVDADPSRRESGVENARWKSCFPFQINGDSRSFEYRATSGVQQTLVALIAGSATLAVFSGKKTLEYDLALANESNPVLVTDAVTHGAVLIELCAAPDTLPTKLKKQFETDELASLNAIQDVNDRNAHRFAATYLRCVENAKGEHAFALEKIIRIPPENSTPLQCPEYIANAIKWVTLGTVQPASRAASP